MKNKGFTLVEMLLYMGLLTMLIGLLTRIFTAILDVQLESELNSSLQQDSRYLFSRMVYDINRASEIITPSAPGVQSQTLVLGINGALYTYAAVNGNFMLDKGAGAAALNSYGTQITGVTFTRYGDTSVSMRFIVQSVTQSITGSKEETVETTVALR